MITKQLLLSALANNQQLNFKHKVFKNKDGTPVRARANGKLKTWKREPNMFCLPCKHGLRTYFYIKNYEDNNASDWELV